MTLPYGPEREGTIRQSPNPVVWNRQPALSPVVSIIVESIALPVGRIMVANIDQDDHVLFHDNLKGDTITKSYGDCMQPLQFPRESVQPKRWVSRIYL